MSVLPRLGPDSSDTRMHIGFRALGLLRGKFRGLGSLGLGPGCDRTSYMPKRLQRYRSTRFAKNTLEGVGAGLGLGLLGLRILEHLRAYMKPERNLETTLPSL